MPVPPPTQPSSTALSEAAAAADLAVGVCGRDGLFGHHARIWREGEAYLVEDLGSVNGTVINDIIRLEPRRPRPLDSGDRIKMGETTLHFLLG